MTDLITIGSHVQVSFPEAGISGVPAKVDTGADSSSVWASNVRLESKKLTFCLFDSGSAFFTGKEITAEEYKTTNVKNSFGHNEYRYKVKMRVKLGRHTATGWFTLANRANNSFPILLGKSYLKDRFVVDVAKSSLPARVSRDQRVLVLSSNPQANKVFFDVVAARNATPVTYDNRGYNSLLFYINAPRTKVLCMPDRMDVTKYRLTYFKNHAKDVEFATSVAEYLDFKSAPFIDREVAMQASHTKLTQYMRLACHGFPVPKTICGQNELLRGMFDEVSDTLKLPFVLKEIASDRGINNYLIHERAEFNAILGAATPDQTFLAQEYIENEGFLRVYVLGRETPLVVVREPEAHANPLKAHLNKPFGGVNAHKLEPGTILNEVQDICIRAAHCLERQIAGVDIIQDKKNNKWYILEVNSSPQLRSGSFQDQKISMVAEYFDNELTR